MPIEFLTRIAAGVCLLVFGSSAVLANGFAAPAYAVHDGKPALVLAIEGREFQLPVFVDATVNAEETAEAVTLVAFEPGRYLVVTDRHASLPQPLSRCGAGEESFLRVIALVRGEPREVMTVKLASCIDGIEPASDPLVDDGQLRVEWLSNAMGGLPGTLAFDLGKPR